MRTCACVRVCVCVVCARLHGRLSVSGLAPPPYLPRTCRAKPGYLHTIYTCVCVRMCVCMSVWMCVCVYIYIYIYIYMYIYIYIKREEGRERGRECVCVTSNQAIQWLYIYIYIYRCVCVIYIYIYIYTHTHTHIHACTPVCRHIHLSYIVHTHSCAYRRPGRDKHLPQHARLRPTPAVWPVPGNRLCLSARLRQVRKNLREAGLKSRWLRNVRTVAQEISTSIADKYVYVCMNVMYHSTYVWYVWYVLDKNLRQKCIRVYCTSIRIGRAQYVCIRVCIHI